MKYFSSGIVWALIFLFASLAGAEPAGAWPVEAPGEEDTVMVEWAPTEDLAQGYIHKQLYPDRSASLLRARRSAGDRLTGDSKRLYLQLYPLMAQVAAGDLASTVFVLPVEDVYETVAWTKEELGIEELVRDGQFTPEVGPAMIAKIKAVDISAVIHALQADCPFELYWYNKSTGGGTRISYPGYTTLDGQTVSLKGNVTVRMSVAQEYATGDYLMDTSYGQGARTAAENAQAIVALYEELPDDERLLAYKNEICDLTAYNYAALSSGTPYGNPWQLVWVFDGDEETKVVCEGYAKAFQYLNDLSASEITVISVMGTMNDGRHMWNIVTMEDGRNYMVDVTNCDTDMAGYPERLFLVGCDRGNPTEGYPVVAGDRTLMYRYDEGQSFSEAELTLAAWRYDMGGPPMPVLCCAQAELYEFEAVTVAESDLGFMYDSFVAEMTRIVLEDGETETQLLTSDDPLPWALGQMPPGEYTLRFAGIRDGVQSDWTDSESLLIRGMEEWVPECVASTDHGCAGYHLAVRLPWEADGVYVLETEEEMACQGRDVLIPLTAAGDQTYTLALLWQGKASAFASPVTVEVTELGEGTLMIPPATEAIEEEAFRGSAAARVVIPASVTRVASFAFADCANLQIVELMGETAVEEDAFDNCPRMVYCIHDTEEGFAWGRPFVVP